MDYGVKAITELTAAEPEDADVVDDVEYGVSGSEVCVGVVDAAVPPSEDEGGGIGEGACRSLALLPTAAGASNRLLSMLRVARCGARKCRHT